jgi:ABC-2 type transport system ATP-binding protein
MYEVSETCDRIILLNRGKVIANDTTSEVIKMMGGVRIGPNELENAFFKYMGSDLQ